MVIARLRAVRRNAQVDQLAKQAAEIALRLATLPALRGERERQLRHVFRGACRLSGLGQSGMPGESGRRMRCGNSSRRPHEVDAVVPAAVAGGVVSP